MVAYSVWQAFSRDLDRKFVNKIINDMSLKEMQGTDGKAHLTSKLLVLTKMILFMLLSSML
jgi:hypothetical protein